jgi:hypothetical protein
LISNNLRLVELVEAREPMDPSFDGDGGEEAVYPTQTSANEALHTTTNLEEAQKEAPCKHHRFVFPFKMKQWLWFSKLPCSLPFHALLEPMVTV